MSLNYKAACEQAGTLFELTPTKFHFQITNQISGTKTQILSDVLWQRLADTVKEGVKDGLGDIALVEVVESGDPGEYHTMNHLNHVLNSGSLVLPGVLFEYKGSRAPRTVVWPKDYQVSCIAQYQFDFFSLNHKAACEQAGTFFELTPAKFHLQITNQITGTKKPILSDVLWQRLADTVKEGFKKGLGDIALVEVMESGDPGEYHTMNHPNHILNSGSLVLPGVLFEYKGSHAPRTVVWPKDYQVN